ncbi:MAG: oligosaccharide flippase family protein [Eubacterium sp.]|nr:oligosaccharide flippase family protein [Eubacterium sp.]
MKISKKQNFINIVANILALIVQFAINFFVVPKIIKNLGTEAIGYVNLSTDIVSYFSIITIVFNSVAGRFITLEINKDNYDKASEYINSVLTANGVICAAIALFGAGFIPFIDRFLKISPQYLGEVKITFLITWLSSIISIITSVFTVGTFAKNKLNINAYRNITSYLVRITVIIVLFSFFPLKVYFMPLATLASTVFLGIANYNLTHRFLPELKINPRLARLRSVKEIASAGIWMSFISLSGILMRNVDTVLANLLFDQQAMGNLSTARTIPNAISMIVGTVGTMFTPTFIALYSENRHDDLVNEAKTSIRVNGLILMVPVAGFIAFSKPFYALWLSGVDEKTINLIVTLSTLTVIQAFFNSQTYALSQLSVVVNKLKIPVFVSFGIGVVNIIVELILGKTTDLGVIILVVPSLILICSRYIFFNSWYAARIIGAKPKEFYLTVLRTSLPIPVLIGLFSIVTSRFVLDSWFRLIAAAGVCGVIGYAIAAVIIIPIKEIKPILGKILKRIKK